MSTPVDSARYISLETFKKDGSGVKTPVWFANVDDKLVVHTEGRTFKIKRLRKNPRVRVASCNASGKKILGPWLDGTARVVPSAEAKQAEAALARKYTWQQAAFSFIARLVGGVREPVIIEITLAAN